MEQKEANVAKAVNATTNDFKSRAPGWISQEVTNLYTIKKKEVSQSKKGARAKGTIKVAGVLLNNVELEYEGTLMTPVHFKMKPRTRPKRAVYRVNVEIKKGKETRLPTGVFLAGNGRGTYLPFQREGTNRLPIHSIKSVSVPQMMTSKEAENTINKRINEELGKRLEHHLERFGK